MSFALVRCDANGTPVDSIPPLPEPIVANCVATADLYQRIGFVEPWVGYVAVDSGQAVGGGAFVGAPKENRVEVAYYTLKEMEGRGYAGRTAAELVAIARRHQPGITITAFTLPERNASTRILERLEFKLFGTAQDPDAGTVWEWRT